VVAVRIPLPSADSESRDRLTAELWEAGTAGVADYDGYLEAYFEDASVAARFGEPRALEEVDWEERTRAAFPPLLVGERFFVVPPWFAEPAPPGRLRLVVNPSQQFGTGHHRTTQLCLEAMERHVRPGDSVLDVGSGSGILSLAAKLLGAGRVVACDLDPEAARVAPFFVGSADAVRAGAFDVVVSNISEAVLGPLRADLERVARVRILSGFQDESGEWACVVL
jgi:ribosomal protein L11 methyltransferase